MIDTSARSAPRLIQNITPLGRCFERPRSRALSPKSSAFPLFPCRGAVLLSSEIGKCGLLGDRSNLWQQKCPAKAALKETPLCDVHSTANEAATSLERALRVPFVLFGHSLGGLIAFETAKILEGCDSYRCTSSLPQRVLSISFGSISGFTIYPTLSSPKN